ncbi:MAG: competence/damage-inducible protein A [Candidatus Zixiibacteriota bacterium]
MDIEIITIGDELLTGHTIDSNAKFIAQHLTGLGFSVKHISTAGDTLEQMEEAILLGLKRAKIVITTGGLGPTDDDNTKKAIVKVFKRNLVYHENILNEIKARYARRGIEMPAINQNQALLPQGADFFPNQYGSAVGICIAENNKIFIALPGVPQEMEQIMLDEVIPYLTKMKPAHLLKVIKIRTTGIVESKLADLLKPKIKLGSGVKLAFLPAYGGVDLRIMVTDEDETEAAEKAQLMERNIEATIGKHIYGKENDSLESVVGQLLIDNDKTLATAESSTGGQLGMIITSVPGSSSYFLGGAIVYSNESKINNLGVTEELIEEYGAVSEECALAMAAGCRKLFKCDYALSITGIAGPAGATDSKPIGTTYIGLVSAHTTIAKKFNFGTNREATRTRAAYAALELLRRDILDIK